MPPQPPASPEHDRLREEIAEQPAVVGRLLDRQWAAIQRVAAAIRDRAPSVAVLVARGSSDNVAIYGRYLLEICNRQLTSLAAPSTVTLYGSGPRLNTALIVAVSQSGRGEDVVSYVQAARNQGAMTVAIVNDATSPLAGAAEWVLECLAGPELSVPATKTVTAQMTILAALSLALGGGDPERGLAPLPGAIEQALALQPDVASFVDEVGPDGPASVIGRGFAYPVALELALKLKEMAYLRAEPFSAADFYHGPIALVDPAYTTLLVDVGGQAATAARDAAQAIRQRGGRACLLRVGDPRLKADSPAPEGPSLALDVPLAEPYAPIVALVLGQLVAFELTLLRGLDPARPRGLKKVTSTR
jgi:glucosamine--fructose-6-phosphate aminotransferase (isomerizing)